MKRSVVRNFVVMIALVVFEFATGGTSVQAGECDQRCGRMYQQCIRYGIDPNVCEQEFIDCQIDCPWPQNPCYQYCDQNPDGTWFCTGPYC